MLFLTPSGTAVCPEMHLLLCPWASPMGVGGHSRGAWAAFGVATVPVLVASGRKRQENGDNKKAPLPSFTLGPPASQLLGCPR